MEMTTTCAGATPSRDAGAHPTMTDAQYPTTSETGGDPR